MNGKIIYSEDRAICEMGIQDVTKKTIDALRDTGIKKLYVQEAQFSHLSKVDNDKFLFEQWDDKGYFIKEFDRKTKKVVRTLCEGTVPVYMPKYRKFFFFKNDKELSIANIDNPSKSAHRIQDVKTYYNYVVPVSDDEIVFARWKEGKEHKDGIWKYNLSTDVLEKLPLNQCDYPELWIGESKELFCQGQVGNKKGTFLMDLEGRINDKLSFDLATYPVLYIPESNQLVVSYTALENFDEIQNLWLLDLSTGQKRMISKYNGFNPGDGIYYPD